jgi:hypothetical protein
MTDRALFIGIDAYKFSPLQGCVADAEALAKRVAFGWADDQQTEKFKWGDMSICTDKRAHSEGFKSRLSWLGDGLKRGDRMVLTYSGHGFHVPVRNEDSYEVDGLIEGLCPVNWDPDDDDSWIIDVDFIDVLSSIPEGVNAVAFLDSCFGGGMANRGTPADVVSRHYPIERIPDFMGRLEAAREKKVGIASLIRSGGFPHVAFIEGCQEWQTCSETTLGGTRRGVASYFMEQVMAKRCNDPLEDVVSSLADEIRAAGFQQVPRIVGPNEILSVPFGTRL